MNIIWPEKNSIALKVWLEKLKVKDVCFRGSNRTHLLWKKGNYLHSCRIETYPYYKVKIVIFIGLFKKKFNNKLCIKINKHSLSESPLGRYALKTLKYIINFKQSNNQKLTRKSLIYSVKFLAALLWSWLCRRVRPVKRELLFFSLKCLHKLGCLIWGIFSRKL